jgi:CRISPR/Cas system-associated endonuclease Cas1
MPMDLAEMFKKFIEAANQAVAQNELDEEATTRLACNVIRACHKRKVRDKKKLETLKQWIPEIKKQMLSEIAQVVNFELGPLDSDQEERYKALVDASFKTPK